MTRALSTILLISLITVLFISVPTTTVQPKAESLAVPSYTRGYMTAADTVEIESVWDSIYSSVSTSEIRSIVRTISEDHPNRIWFPLDKDASDMLEGAWEWANQTLDSVTGGDLSFKIVTQHMTLLSVKNGTESHLAPIVIAGLISSRYIPGANSFGSSVAGVLQAAKIINTMNLTNDVYFALINTFHWGYGSSSSGNEGMESLLEMLDEQYRTPAAVIWFSNLLFNPADEEHTDEVALWSGSESGIYHQNTFLKDISLLASQTSGSSRLVTPTTGSSGFGRSGARESSAMGIPSLYFSQYYYDGYSGTESDVWDRLDYSYENAKELIATAISVVAYLGTLGSGKEIYLKGSMNIENGTQNSKPLYLTGRSFVNITITWEGNATISAEIVYSLRLLYSRTEDDNSITMNYLPSVAGEFTLEVTNLSNETISISYNYTHWHDFDRDGLSAWDEVLVGTDDLSADSDRDDVLDIDELEGGTDPLDRDSDDDGATDGVELVYGSDPLVVDTDQDTISDGDEIEMGTNPILKDSDSDFIDDNIELDMGTDPSSNDTDLDGLIDGLELEAGTDPFLPDSDGDGLGDYFEILNSLDPLSVDTDQDGLSDAYEVEHCLKPFDKDTDADGIDDLSDWAPREHWMNIIPTAAFGVFLLSIMAWLFVKKRAYDRRTVT